MQTDLVRRYKTTQISDFLSCRLCCPDVAPPYRITLPAQRYPSFPGLGARPPMVYECFPKPAISCNDFNGHGLFAPGAIFSKTCVAWSWTRAGPQAMPDACGGPGENGAVR